MPTAANSQAEHNRVVFKYVYIPADHTESIEERTFECPQSDDVLAFINMCKAHFQRTSQPRSKEEQQQWQKAFKASMGDKAAGVDDAMINMLAAQQMVEPVALLANAPATGYVGVYMYCDDQANLKQLPTNMRATQIAAEAGQALQVSGDVFIGRYFDNEEDFRRMDFTLPELSSAAPWMKEARAQILRRGERNTDAQQLLQQLRQQPPQQQQPAAAAAKQQPPSDVEKAKGNAAYGKADYQTALEHYSAAIKLDSSNTAARNNRAMTYLSLHMYTEAAADAAAVIEAEPGNIKALLRRAAAAEGLGEMQAAAADCARALEVEPKNIDAQRRLARLQQLTSQQQQQQQQEGTQEGQQDKLPPPPPHQQQQQV